MAQSSVEHSSAPSSSCIDVISGLVRQIVPDGIVLHNAHYPNPTLKKVGLSHIIVPRIGTPEHTMTNGTYRAATKSEPFSIEAREFLRRNLVGKVVSFAPSFTIPNSNKQVGFMCIDRNWELNVAAEMVKRGLATVRPQALNQPFGAILQQLEKIAKDRKLNIWSATGKGTVLLEYDPMKEANIEGAIQCGKPLDAVVEYVINACTFKLLLLPGLDHATVSLVGVTVPAPSQEEVKKYVENRLLQRDVLVTFHINDRHSSTCYATVICKHNNKDIGVYLLSKGYAKICRWNFKYVVQKDLYLNVEKAAKMNKLGVWSDQGLKETEACSNASSNGVGLQLDLGNQQFEKAFDAIVVYTAGTEALEVLRLQDSRIMQIRLSSIRVKRIDTSKADEATRLSINNLQLQVPFSIREYMRKNLVGRQCTVSVDYKFSLTPSGQNVNGIQRTKVVGIDGRYIIFKTNNPLCNSKKMFSLFTISK